MALANLQREERIGLGIAVVLHAALVAMLVVQAMDDVDTIPVPERMSVSLADEVALESTSPDPSATPQAAIAPTLSETPAPAVMPDPVAEAIPEPERTVTPPRPAERRPVSQPTRTSPRETTRTPPRETTRTPPRRTESGGSRIGNDFLEGSSAGERSNSTGSPAANFGPREAASLNSAIARQLKPHWSAPQGADAELLVTIVRFRLNSDGSLSGEPSCVSQSGETPSNATQKALHCERAIRAVKLASPFNLPDQFYDKWKLVNSRFDRRL